MHTKFAVALSLALITPTGAAAAQTVPAWAVGTARYRTTVVQEITQEAMGDSQSMTNTTYREATVSVSKAAQGLDISVRLDTTHLTSSQGVASPNLKGVTYKATTLPGGYPTTSTVTDAAGAEHKLPLAASLRAFLPRLKPGATRGQSWADTLAVITEENGLVITTTTATRFTYAGDTIIGGARVLAIAIAADGKAKGGGDTPNGKASLDGTVTTVGQAWVTPTGQLVGVESKATIARTLVIEEENVSVSITQKQTLSTSRIP
ncbi:MAG: hypothetical protein HEQ38_03140 [Gemmatimonas sp.]|jgi:hypothetical protein|uniref:hypothetical protein n=1 Tax=Gemmatimonas sp. TaxID=1962908 RepID=UPI0031C68388|nr:hypothetical protein [Gemmatimonas sp.]